MELHVQDIPEDSILHFLGCKKEGLDVVLQQHIQQMKKTLIEVWEPRYVIRMLPLDKKAMRVGSLTLAGHDMQRLLKESHACILMGATLGMAVDRKLKELQLQDMEQAVIFDACANAGIEAVCDTIQEKIQKQYPHLTDRYSCGYGDLPIHIQKELCTLLDTPKQIGLYVNESSVLLPLKSVTAIIGIANRVQPAILRGCGYCPLRKDCAYRKGGNNCGN